VKVIPLTQGKEALVDDCDYEFLMQWKWQFHQERDRRTGYAARRHETGGKCHRVYMHRLIAARSGLMVDGKQIDHVDGDELNNCRSNLRTSTTSQNLANCRVHRNNTSGFKGVSWKRQAGKFEAYITVLRRKFHLKYFDDPRDAARAYNEAALKHFGEFACLNPV
jgi:hypothetical protein